jgi:hypothetical protein
MAMTRSAGVYLLTDALVLHAAARTRAGIGMAVPPVWRLAVSAAPGEAGATLCEALAAFREVPDPSPAERKVWAATFLKAAGVRSWRALEGGSRSCWIEERAGDLVFTPLRNGGSRGPTKGFQPFGVPPLVVDKALGPEAIGRGLWSALDSSQ